MKKRTIPRKFELHFGKGMITEEAGIACKYHDPTIQLLEFDSGEKALRFCVYHGNRFSRVPLLVDIKDMDQLTNAIHNSKQIKKFIKL